MIVDAETLELVELHRVAARVDARGHRGRRQARADGVGAARSPTTPCNNTREAGDAAARAAPRACRRPPTSAGLAIGSAGTHPFAMWEDQRIVARPRYRDLIAGAPVRRPPGADLRPARARGRRRPGQGDPRRQRHARARAAAAGAVRQLAVLARRRDRPAVHPHADLPRLPARRASRRATRTGTTTRSGSTSWSSAR